MVKVKNGNKEGTSTVAQTVSALKHTDIYVAGDTTMGISIIIMAIDKNFFIKLFDKLIIVIVLYECIVLLRRGHMNYFKYLRKQAKQKHKTLVFPEVAFSDRVKKAVIYLKKHGICDVILIGDESSLVMQNKILKNYTILNPKTFEKTNEMAQSLYEARKDKGLTEDEAKELILDPFYFATMLVKFGYADGMVAGAEVPTARTFKPALQLLRGDDLVSSFMLMVGKNKLTDNPFALADCGLVVNPNSDELCGIAERTAKEYMKLTNHNAKVAFLSYSTSQSAKGESVDKVREACLKFKEKNKDIFAQGEVQLDCALLEHVAKLKLGENASYYGKNNVLIFPDLNSANICYKAISYFGNLCAIGPIAVGFTKPVNDLSRGATVEDIINLSAITVLQCKEKKWKY